MTADPVNPRAISNLLQPSPHRNAVMTGDVVRMARAADGTWFYCEVETILDDGRFTCSVVDAQDWASLMVDGVVPGRQYTVPEGYVLSVVRYGPEPRAT